MTVSGSSVKTSQLTNRRPDESFLIDRTKLVRVKRVSDELLAPGPVLVQHRFPEHARKVSFSSGWTLCPIPVRYSEVGGCSLVECALSCILIHVSNQVGQPIHLLLPMFSLYRDSMVDAVSSPQTVPDKAGAKWEKGLSCACSIPTCRLRARGRHRSRSDRAHHEFLYAESVTLWRLPRDQKLPAIWYHERGSSWLTD